MGRKRSISEAVLQERKIGTYSKSTHSGFLVLADQTWNTPHPRYGLTWVIVSLYRMARSTSGCMIDEHGIMIVEGRGIT